MRKNTHSSKEISSLLNAVLLIVGSVWLFLVLGVPRAYTREKILFLGVLCILSIFDYLFKDKDIRVDYWKYTLLFIIVYMSSLLFGILTGYNYESVSDFPLIQYYVITPITSLLLGMLFYCEDRYMYIKKGLTFFAALISLIDVFALLSFRGAFPHLFIFDYMFVANNSSTDESLVMRMSNDPALIFLIPYSIIMFSNIKKDERILKALNFIAIIFGSFYTVISGRKILEIVVFLSFFVKILLLIRERRIKADFFVPALIAIIIVPLIGSKISTALNVNNIFQSAFTTISNGLKSNDYGMIKRTSNMQALSREWLSNPGTFLVGNGLNSYAADSIANPTSKWSYEIFYNALLAQTGVVGFFVLLFTICRFLNIIYRSYKLNLDYNHLAILVGAISFGIASASNPMLYNVWFWGLMWCEKVYYDEKLMGEEQ